MKELSFCISSGRSAPPEVYEFWKKIWTETFLDLDGIDRVYSDDFTKQDEIIVLSTNRIVVGLVCHRFVDLSLPMNQDDSYFKPWPNLALEKLKRDGNRIAIGSQITIHPDFRKSAGADISVKELLTALSLETLKNKEVDAITGVMRTDKGMNSLFFKCGAQPLARNITYHNVLVDLVAFFPKIKPIIIHRSYLDIIETMKMQSSAAA